MIEVITWLFGTNRFSIATWFSLEASNYNIMSFTCTLSNAITNQFFTVTQFCIPFPIQTESRWRSNWHLTYRTLQYRKCARWISLGDFWLQKTKLTSNVAQKAVYWNDMEWRYHIHAYMKLWYIPFIIPAFIEYFKISFGQPEHKNENFGICKSYLYATMKCKVVQFMQFFETEHTYISKKKGMMNNHLV